MREIWNKKATQSVWGTRSRVQGLFDLNLPSVLSTASTRDNCSAEGLPRCKNAGLETAGPDDYGKPEEI